MPKARRSSYNMAFKLKVVVEAEAVKNNSETAWEYKKIKNKKISLFIVVMHLAAQLVYRHPI